MALLLQLLASCLLLFCGAARCTDLVHITQLDHSIVGVAVDMTVEHTIYASHLHCWEINLATTLLEIERLTAATKVAMANGLCSEVSPFANSSITHPSCRVITEALDTWTAWRFRDIHVGSLGECHRIHHLPAYIGVDFASLLKINFEIIPHHHKLYFQRVLIDTWLCIINLSREFDLMSESLLLGQVPSFASFSCAYLTKSLEVNSYLDCNDLGNRSLELSTTTMRLKIDIPMIKNGVGITFIPIPILIPGKIERASFLHGMPYHPFHLSISSEIPTAIEGSFPQSAQDCLMALFSSTGTCHVEENHMTQPFVFPLDTEGTWVIVAAAPHTLSIRATKTSRLQRIPITGRVIVKVNNLAECCASIRIGRDVNLMSLTHFNNFQFVYENQANNVSFHGPPLTSTTRPPMPTLTANTCISGPMTPPPIPPTTTTTTTTANAPLTLPIIKTTSAFPFRTTTTTPFAVRPTPTPLLPPPTPLPPATPLSPPTPLPPATPLPPPTPIPSPLSPPYPLPSSPPTILPSPSPTPSLLPSPSPAPHPLSPLPPPITYQPSSSPPLASDITETPASTPSPSDPQLQIVVKANTTSVVFLVLGWLLFVILSIFLIFKKYYKRNRVEPDLELGEVRSHITAF